MKHAVFFKDFRRTARLLRAGCVFTAIDTETTGLRPESGSIIQIGAVRFDSTGVLASYEALINPGCPVPPLVSEITHITDDMLCDKPHAADVLPGFLEFIGDSILIAHNAGFDISFIDAELARCARNPLTNKVIDTLALSRWAYPVTPKHTLQYLAAALRIQIKHAHRADDDARVCMELFLRCLKDTASVQKP